MIPGLRTSLTMPPPTALDGPRCERPKRFPMRLALVLLLPVIASACGSSSSEIAYDGPTEGWSTYGNDPGGLRYSSLTQITPDNVHLLEKIWTYHAGDMSDGSGDGATTALEVTPILVDDSLVLCTPFNRVIALDPETGEERWVFDPTIDRSVGYANQYVCRGVASWLDLEAAPGDPCRRRILTATAHSRLIALDAASGEKCGGFGVNGEVDLRTGVGELEWPGEYQVTSPPAVVGDLAIVGSAVGDNSRLDAPSGVVRAYDARDGSLRWAWDSLPPDLEQPPEPVSEEEGAFRHGTANVWAVISVDEERDLVFLPTGNTSPDYYGGQRHGSDYYASSVVALRASTGEVVWHFQTVHHDLWDFDVPAQPTLFTMRRDGEEIPALVQPTKMGHLFFLHRETGDPLFPVEERPVPQTDVPGEVTAVTQPFPVKPPPLSRQELDPSEDAFGLLGFDRRRCREIFESLRWDGMFTPPSFQGSIMYPGNGGGSNWGGVAVDPERGLVVANTMNFPWAVWLFPAERMEEERRAHPESEIGPQRGTPYGLRREIILSPLGIPCGPPPWGTLAAVDIAAGDIRWQIPFGTLRDFLPIPLPLGGRWGTPNLGGPMVTASGLIFIGASMDDYLRAYDVETGEELWKEHLPAGPQATPMTYRLRPESRQFVVIAAGGHGRFGTTLGDSIVAFALPES